MRESDLALIFERCLAEIERGGRPDSVAARYPAAGADLAYMLNLASQLRSSQDAYTPPTDFLHALGQRLRALPA